MRRCPGLQTCLVLSCVCLPAFAQPSTHPPGEEVRRGVSPPLRDLVPATPMPKLSHEILNKVDFLPPGPGNQTAPGPDPLRQTVDLADPFFTKATTPGPLLSFDGTSDDDNAAVSGGRVVPPDAVGDVGPSHYVQMTNLVFEIFDKSGGSLLGPLPNNSLWQGFGGICETDNDGDPIVLYDQGADRWLLSQFGVGADGHQCIAVSQTGDPTGAYYLYDVVLSPSGCFADYPKLGLWTDGYYLTANEFCINPFLGGFIFQSAMVAVFDRASMLSGGPANAVLADVTTGAGTAFNPQPSHWEGPTAPAPASEHLLVQAWDDAAWGSGTGPDGYRLWKVEPNFAGGSVAVTEIGLVTSAGFDADLCGFGPCVPQPSPGELLESLSQFTMYRLMYRNFGGHETLLASHTVDADGADTAGVRWVELRNSGPGTPYSLHQAGTYAPADGENRWLPAIAMDGSGNIAVAYAVAGTGTFPSIRYTSRGAGDPPGTLTGGEMECVAGGGVQIDSSNRWGDYASMSVDPVDDCTFWLTHEYYAESGSYDFNTRICSFKRTDCGSCDATESPEVSCGDGEDNDCDGLVDGNDPDCCPDADLDGFTAEACGGSDCNDADPAINLSAAESCADAIDNDCDGAVDCGDSDCGLDALCCPDADLDGFTAEACGGNDCDDADPAIHPGALELCLDFVDNDCDALVDCDDTTACGSDPACACAAKGASCTVDADCCSNKCRGPAGNRSCK